LKLSKLGLFTLPLLLLGLAAPLVHAQTDISSFNWIGALRNGNDPFYSSAVVGYRTGTTATLAIIFANMLGNPAVNVTRVMVVFDWGLNYTSKGVPVVVNGGVLRTFNITFTVPGTGTATNLVLHTYSITVSFTDIPRTGPQTRSAGNSNFAIFSNDQADAMTLMQNLGGPATSGYLFPVFRTAQASALAAQATLEANLGQSLYSSGDFTNAKIHLANASNLLGNTTSIEQSMSSALDFSGIVSGWGGLLLGIGATIIGVSALIYVVQHRRQTRYTPTPATPKTTPATPKTTPATPTTTPATPTTH
jgi:hypothetical protein